MEYIDITPTWTEILPTLRFMVEQVTTRDPETKTKSPSIVMENFWKQLKIMAEAADKWNEHCKMLDEMADEDEQQRLNEELAVCERCHGSRIILEPRGIAGEAFDADFVEVPCPECSE